MFYYVMPHHNPVLSFSASFSFIHYCYFLCPISTSYLDLSLLIFVFLKSADAVSDGYLFFV